MTANCTTQYLVSKLKMSQYLTISCIRNLNKRYFDNLFLHFVYLNKLLIHYYFPLAIYIYSHRSFITVFTNCQPILPSRSKFNAFSNFTHSTESTSSDIVNSSFSTTALYPNINISFFSYG